MVDPDNNNESFTHADNPINHASGASLQRNHDDLRVGGLGLQKYYNIIINVIRRHPRIFSFLVLILAIIFYLPAKIYILVVSLSFLCGYLIGIPSQTSNVFLSSAQLKLYLSHLSGNYDVLDRPEAIMPTKLNLTPAIESELGFLLDDIINDIINLWYVPLCRSGEIDFQLCVRSTINAAINRLLLYCKSRNKDMLTLMIYGVTNALVVHMEEYKALEVSKLSYDKFLSGGHSRRTHIGGYLAELENLRKIAGVFLKKLLPKQESRSILLNSLLKEILSGNVLSVLIDKLADPDFINESIIKIFQGSVKIGTELERGTNLVTLKGKSICRNLSIDHSSGGVYLVVHLAGKKVKTRRIHSLSELWNEVFQFKIPDSSLESARIYLQLVQFNYMGQDQSLGFAKLAPLSSDSDSNNQTSWLKFIVKTDGFEQPVNRLAIAPEVLIKLDILRWKNVAESNENRQAFETIPKNITRELETSLSSRADLDDVNSIKYKEAAKINPLQIEENIQDLPDHGIISLDAALQNNELFMEFIEYLDSVKAPPYLQFIMNVDALRQFASISLGVDVKALNGIENYFKQGILSEAQLEQLRMIKHDAADVFSTHFSEYARYRIPLDLDMQQEMQQWLALSDHVDERGFFSGGPIGPNIFSRVYNWVTGMLEEVYYPKFKQSDAFNRFLDRAHFTTLNFTIDDDRLSVYSQESSANVNGDDRHYRESSTPTLIEATDGESNSNLSRILTEISLSKQKLALIKEKISSMEKRSDREALQHLKEERKALETQIQSLLRMASEGDHDNNHTDDIWLDLSEVSVQVRMVDSYEGRSGTLSSIWSSTVAPVITAVSDSDFKITVMNNEGSYLSGVRKRYTDIYVLHSQLKEQFPKVSKMEFPEMSILGSHEVEKSLDTYLNLLVSDEIIRQSIVLRRFFSFDYEASESRLGEKLKDVFKTAAHRLKAPFTLSGNKWNTFYQTSERHTMLDLPLSSSKFANENYDNLKVQKTYQSSVNLTSGENKPRSLKNYSLTPKDTTGQRQDKKESHAINRVPSAELPTLRVTHLEPEVHVNELFSIGEFSDEEIEMLVETVFALVIEAFDLKEPNQWLRRKLLGVFKQLLKQAYGDTLNKSLSKLISVSLGEEAILRYIKLVREQLYPNGEFVGKRPPPIPKSTDQKFVTMVEARTIFLKNTPEILYNVAGRYNSICGMTRIFNAFQNKELNKTLIYTCLDIVMKLLFSDKPVK